MADIRLTLPDDLPAELRVAVARCYLGALVDFNRQLIADGFVRVGIYASGVRYEIEPPGSDEEFADALTCYRRGWGDCDDLAAWRCAELLEAGHHASLFIGGKRRNGRYLMHCTVRLENGSIEDPSKRLMR